MYLDIFILTFSCIIVFHCSNHFIIVCISVVDIRNIVRPCPTHCAIHIISFYGRSSRSSYSLCGEQTHSTSKTKPSRSHRVIVHSYRVRTTRSHTLILA